MLATGLSGDVARRRGQVGHRALTHLVRPPRGDATIRSQREAVSVSSGNLDVAETRPRQRHVRLAKRIVAPRDDDATVRLAAKPADAADSAERTSGGDRVLAP